MEFVSIALRHAKGHVRHVMGKLGIYWHSIALHYGSNTKKLEESEEKLGTLNSLVPCCGISPGTLIVFCANGSE